VPSEPDETVRLAWKLIVAAMRTVIARPMTAAQAAPLPAATNNENGTDATATLGAAAARPCAKTPQKPRALRSKPLSSAEANARPPNATSVRTGVDMLTAFLADSHRAVAYCPVRPN
jgi:hypothetical protein